MTTTAAEGQVECGLVWRPRGAVWSGALALAGIGLGLLGSGLSNGYFALTHGPGPCSDRYVVMLAVIHGASVGAAIAAVRAKGMVLLPVVSVVTCLGLIAWLLVCGVSTLSWPFA